MRDLGKTLQGLVYCIKLKGQKGPLFPDGLCLRIRQKEYAFVILEVSEHINVIFKIDDYLPVWPKHLSVIRALSLPYFPQR